MIGLAIATVANIGVSPMDLAVRPEITGSGILNEAGNHTAGNLNSGVKGTFSYVPYPGTGQCVDDFQQWG